MTIYVTLNCDGTPNRDSQAYVRWLDDDVRFFITLVQRCIVTLPC